jgi:hypothetical protein
MHPLETLTLRGKNTTLFGLHLSRDCTLKSTLRMSQLITRHSVAPTQKVSVNFSKQIDSFGIQTALHSLHQQRRKLRQAAK